LAWNRYQTAAIGVQAMSGPDRPVKPPMVNCQKCLKEIPPDETKSAERDDYVLYFCGLECYEEWQKQQHGHERGA
jgi:hypothetical protein